MKTLHDEIRACTHCVPHLPLGPRPVFRADPDARVAVIGQAPGTKVHASGIPWDDPSGEHLCEWLGITHAELVDGGRFAIVPMGFCYPGRKGQGDAPPRPECAPRWHQRLLDDLPRCELRLLVGQYAQQHYLGKRRKKTLTETVRAFADYGPVDFPLPHPSWRSRGWMKRNPWFEADVLPALRAQIAALLSQTSPGQPPR